MRYHETHEGRGLLYIKVTEAEAEELWRLVHHHMPDDRQYKWLKAGAEFFQHIVDVVSVGEEAPQRSK